MMLQASYRRLRHAVLGRHLPAGPGHTLSGRHLCGPVSPRLRLSLGRSRRPKPPDQALGRFGRGHGLGRLLGPAQAGAAWLMT